MANIMSMKSIKNHPHRDGFDLSRKFAFTAKLGELLPVYVEDVFPGDHFSISTDWFTRSQPVTSPAYTRFSEYFDFFFVPYHLLWRYFPQFVIQTNDDNWATGITENASQFTQHPYMSSKELFNVIRQSCASINENTGVASPVYSDVNGFYYAYGAQKLLQYLGYGITNTKDYDYNGNIVRLPSESTVGDNTNVGDVALNPFPLAAYQKIYNDHYRNTQWESPSPFSYNFDYLDGKTSMKVPFSSIQINKFYYSGLLTLRYCNYNKDYFTGRMPSKQYGTEAIAAPLINPDGSLPSFTSYPHYVSNSQGGATDVQIGVLNGKPSSSSPSGSLVVADILNKVGISALALRQAEFLQKWKEITQSGGTDYVSQIQKHFGVKPSKEMAHRSTYIGGFDHKFGIDEVVNTNLSSDSSEANIYGKGVNAGHGSLSFDVKEHGIILGIYHMSLLPEYSAQMTDKLMVKTQPTDYVIPEMDNVGMQAVSAREFAGYLIPYTSSQQSVMDSILGYVPRYAEYKTHVDRVGGAFASTLGNWVTPLNKISALQIKSGNTAAITSSWFYKVNPKILNSVLSVNCDSTVDTDQFLINCGFDVKAVRNISRDGLPY